MKCSLPMEVTDAPRIWGAKAEAATTPSRNLPVLMYRPALSLQWRAEPRAEDQAVEAGLVDEIDWQAV